MRVHVTNIALELLTDLSLSSKDEGSTPTGAAQWSTARPTIHNVGTVEQLLVMCLQEEGRKWSGVYCSASHRLST